MCSLEERLERETKKWMERIKKMEIKEVNEVGKWIRENVEAYTSDASYFLEKRDLIRAFECVVWAWAFLEIGAEIGAVRTEFKT